MSIVNVSLPTVVEFQITPEMILDALQILPRESLEEVLRFVQFLSWKSLNNAEFATDDQALWEAVQANQIYQTQHPEEPLERFSSGAEFLKAMVDL
jgi:hypothetical protein